MVMTKPIISAIVCTYNRADFLEKCLTAIAQQTMNHAAYEVIIVNNNSTDHTIDITNKFESEYANFHAVVETKQGLSAARNRGMREANSTIAAFTDDDAIPSPDWLAKLSNRFSEMDDQVVAVGGEIDPIWETPRPKWLTDRLLHPLSAALLWSDTPRMLIGDEWLCEVNSAYRIAPVLEAGGFPEHLGRIGTNLLSGDNAVNGILLDQGAKFFFDPEIRVQHFIPKERLTINWFKRRMFWQGITGFYVNTFLRERGCKVPYSMQIELPMNEKTWLDTFDDSYTDKLSDSLGTLYNLGYLLASQNLIAGR